jgi:hypothetical protein
MSDGFTIGSASAAPTIFSCPKCNETIDVSAPSCRFCGAPINADFARHAADVLARINQACSDASYMRSTALTLPVFFVLRFLPIASMLGSLGWTVLIFLIPAWAIRWWVRYGSIETGDPDYIRARKTVKIVGIVVSVLAVLSLLLFFALIVFGFASGMARH